MSFISSLLSDTIGSGKGATLGDDLVDIIAVIAVIFGGLVTLYALYLAYAMATASDAGKRAEAKKRVINSIAIILIIVALIGILKVVGMRGGNAVTTTGWIINVSGSGETYNLTLNFDDEGFDLAAEDQNKTKESATWRVINGSGWTIEGNKGTATLKKGEGATSVCTVAVESSGSRLAQRDIP